MYVYNAEFSHEKFSYIKSENLNGWIAKCNGSVSPLNNDTKTMFILSHIQGKPVVSLSHAFLNEEINKRLEKVVIPYTVTDISYLLHGAGLKTNIIFEINGKPTKYEKCFKFADADLDTEATAEQGELAYKSDFVITVTGKCDQSVKEAIAKETEDIKMNNVVE